MRQQCHGEGHRNGKDEYHVRAIETPDTFHIAAFQCYDGATVMNRLGTDASLGLVLEPDNSHDPSAVEIRFERTKLGNVSASDNESIATMMFYGHACCRSTRRPLPGEQILVASS